MPGQNQMLHNGTNSPMPGGGAGPQGPPGLMGPNGMPGVGPDQPGPMLQQQNTIFVFTTGLANEAANACVKGHFRNIIDFHRQLPATNEFLKNMHHQQMMQQQGRGGPRAG
jgi:hypothetical protein